MCILPGSVGLKRQTVTEVYVYYAGLPVVKLFIAWLTGMFCAGSSLDFRDRFCATSPLDLTDRFCVGSPLDLTDRFCVGNPLDLTDRFSGGSPLDCPA